MNEPPVTLVDMDGRAFATAGLRDLGGGAHALVLTWIDLAIPPESTESSIELLAQLVSSEHTQLQAPCFARVVRVDARTEPVLLAARSRWHRAALWAIGFKIQSQRLELRLPLSDALSAASKWPPSARLEWQAVASEPGPSVEQAARLLKACAVGDPDTDPDEDALGFLLARRDDPALQLTPECLQIARWEGREAAIMAISVKPDSGWCSFHYLGVMPECRRQGFAQEAMLRGFELMKRLGGREYHDGTAAENRAALALFNSLGAEPDRTLEQWRLVR